MNPLSFDILIIGAGLVGTSMINTLHGNGLRICILDKNFPTKEKKSTDWRPITLSYGSSRILQTLGLWETLNLQACPIHTVHVSDQGALGKLSFHAKDMKVPALGYVLSFDDLQHTLYHDALSQSHVTFIPIEKIISIDNQSAQTTVVAQTVEGEQKFQTSLLIAADGTNSTGRELLQIRADQYDHEDIAQTALLSLQEVHENIAYERFTDLGALALLPMPDKKKYRLVWSLNKKQVEEIAVWSNQQMLTYLQKIFLNRVNIVSVRLENHYPLKKIIAQEQIRPGVVLLGNAAQTIYPIAAQGFNLGLRDAAALSEVLLDAKAKGKSLGDLNVLQDYVNWRKLDQQQTINITTRISEIFGLQWPLFNRARGLGLLATDLFLPAKKRLALQMMGLSGRVPKLARGVKLT